ncbi:uncharacterized protein N7515_000748 [Penicillium bovifimosum]|uniref:Uncharacterized protein n=1 Tax=Penicillium bovifimosum TaxID=126998 RepID=A0A9W9LA65_9EURO|nr:uncharacterized protein N7515_000748 [Penicillium bovifimosum]KAJ5146184.1 hypothetical protein N7515_000748 [Penicillium bovifimosum]
MPAQTMPDQTMPDENMPDEKMPHETVPHETTTDETIPDKTMPDEAMPESSSSRLKRPRLTEVGEEDTTDDRPHSRNRVYERVSHVAKLLQDWGWSFPQLVQRWIKHNNGGRGKRRARKRVDILRMFFTDDKENTIEDMRDDPITIDVMDVATTYLVEGIRAEFDELRRRPTFGQWNPSDDFKDIDMSQMEKELSKHAPLFTNLMTELAANTHGRGYQRKEEEGYLVMLASILLLKSRRSTATRFPRMLGLYLQDGGVTSRTLSMLGSLGITEHYRTVHKARKRQPLNSSGEDNM